MISSDSESSKIKLIPTPKLHIFMYYIIIIYNDKCIC